jgi:nicotinate-nucleotide pyrophosphorylase (carboxylating)
MAAELEPPRLAIEDAVRRALAEDLTPLGDLTSLLLPDDLRARASFIARQPGVVAGCGCVTETFRQIDPEVAIEWAVDDGNVVEAGATLATVEGRLQSILTAERTALNFLGHLSGIATLTRKYVAAAHGGGSARVWDTRKTTPGLRTLEMAAVRAGGGSNHRGNLSDWILLKDNHLALMGIGGAVDAAKRRWPGRTVHVECDRLDQVEEALAAGADALLLDNMTFDEVRACVAAADAHAEKPGGRRPLLEVSGGVTLDTVAGYAATGVDLISVGAITNSAPVLDIGLDIGSVPNGG